MIENLPSEISAKIEKVDSGCWLWRGHIDTLPGHGYGRYGNNRNRKQAHRLVYELLKGPIPQGLELDHLCRMRNCVRPDHLEAVSHRINVLRGLGVASVNAKKTKCPEGHAYDKFNGRNRLCSICQNTRNKLWMRGYKARNRERINARRRETYQNKKGELN